MSRHVTLNRNDYRNRQQKATETEETKVKVGEIRRSLIFVIKIFFFFKSSEKPFKNNHVQLHVDFKKHIAGNDQMEKCGLWLRCYSYVINIIDGGDVILCVLISYVHEVRIVKGGWSRHRGRKKKKSTELKQKQRLEGIYQHSKALGVAKHRPKTLQGANWGSQEEFRWSHRTALEFELHSQDFAQIRFPIFFWWQDFPFPSCLGPDPPIKSRLTVKIQLLGYEILSLCLCEKIFTSRSNHSLSLLG